MPLPRLKFTSKKNDEANKGLLSFFFSKNSQKAKKSKNLKSPTNADATSPETVASATDLASKFSDSTWGLSYQQNKKTLILDLDNTLIYASKETPEAVDYISVSFERNGEYVVRYVIKRPGVLKFLKKLSKTYNICVFTSAEETYAKKIIEATKISKYIYTLYDRSHCERINAFCFLKNIWSLGFEQKQALLIDDLEMQAKYQPENFVLIKPFEGDSSDRELYVLYPWLQNLNSADDIRVIRKSPAELKKIVIQKQSQKRQDFDDTSVDIDEGCRKTGIRVLECRPKMMRTSNKLSDTTY